MPFCTLTITYFCVSSVFDPVPNCTQQNPLVYRSLPIIILEIELFTALNYFAGAVTTYQSFISIQVSGDGKLVIVISPT